MYCKKTLAIGLSLLVLLVSSVNVFALNEGVSTNEATMKEINSDESISNIDDIVSALDDVDSDVCVEDVSKEGEDYVAEIENVDVSMPVKGGNDVELTLTGEDETIEIEMPSMASNMSSEVTADGSVYYSDDNSDASIILQAISEEIDGEVFAGIRQAIVIENADAPREYAFEFDAGDNSRLVFCDEIDGFNQTEENKTIYLINKDGQVLLELDEPWAKDSNGNDVSTYYEIRGDKVVQIVEFDEKSSFPIIADPTATATKVKTVKGKARYVKKSGYPSGQPIKGFSGMPGDMIYINLKSGKSVSVGVSYPIAGICSVSGSVSVPIGKAGYSVTAYGMRIPDGLNRYKAKVTTTMKCIPWATYRQLKRGKQVTDKGISKSVYAVDVSREKSNYRA